MASLIEKYKIKPTASNVSKESETLTEVQEQDTPARPNMGVDQTEADLKVETIEESDTNDGTNAIDGEKDNGEVSTENDGVVVADIALAKSETVKDVQSEDAGEKVVTDTTVIEEHGPDAQAEPVENHSTTEVLHDENEETKTDGTPTEEAGKELSVGSTEALVSDLLNVIKNNPSLEAQNPFLIESLKVVDQSLGADVSKKSYSHFKSLEQIETGLETILKALKK